MTLGHRASQDSGVREGPESRPFSGDTARSYARYRRVYPAEFVAHLVERCGGPRRRLLDLGCGTGQLLFQLARFFEHAVGIDPEPDMLDEAILAAEERGIVNVDWITGDSAELRELQPVLGRFDLVTIGTAFHFMEPRDTLSALRQIAIDGDVAVAYNGTPMWLHPDPWARAARDVLEDWLGQLSDVDFTSEALQAAENTLHDLGYARITRWEQKHTETIDTEFVVGHLLSAISTDQIAPPQRNRFAQELSRAITRVEPSGSMLETVTTRAVIGHAERA